MFLITGCGRSGTKYTATVLRAAGLDVGHECSGRDGAVSSHWAAVDSEYPVYHQQHRPHFDVVLHQVRDPLASIGSLTTTRADSWRWSARHVALNPLWLVLRRAADYWLLWNRLVEEQAALTYRVEDIGAAWPTICSALEITAPFPEGVPTNANHRKHREVTWDDINTITPRADDIAHMARRYGYRRGT